MMHLPRFTCARAPMSASCVCAHVCPQVSRVQHYTQLVALICGQLCCLLRPLAPQDIKGWSTVASYARAWTFSMASTTQTMSDPQLAAAASGARLPDPQQLLAHMLRAALVGAAKGPGPGVWGCNVRGSCGMRTGQNRCHGAGFPATKCMGRPRSAVAASKQLPRSHRHESGPKPSRTTLTCCSVGVGLPHAARLRR